jgi:hypothetical protein
VLDSDRASPPSAPHWCAPSELPHSSIDHRLLTLGSPSSCRTSPCSSTTTERRHPIPFEPPHRRHTVPMHPCPLLLAQHLPCAPLEISANTLPPASRRRATDERATTSSHAWSKGGDSVGARALQWAAQAVFPTRPGCQVVAQPAFQPTACGSPPRPMGCSLGPVLAQYCAQGFKCFLIVLNFRNCFKLQKFVETCRNV